MSKKLEMSISSGEMTQNTMLIMTVYWPEQKMVKLFLTLFLLGVYYKMVNL
jgi:hypothetical protein